MRKLAWFTLGLSVAAVLFAYFLDGTVMLILGLTAGFASTAVLFLPYSKTTIISMALFGFSVGMLFLWAYDLCYLRYIREMDGETVYITAEATDDSFPTDYGTAVDGICHIDKYKVRIRLYFEGNQTVAAGDVVKAAVKLRYTPRAGEKESTFHQGEGIFLLGYAQRGMTHLPVEKTPAKYYPVSLRRGISQRIEILFPESTAFFAKALLLGDTSEFSFADNIAFQKSGIRHIVAVSGLHISILMSLVYTATGRRKWYSLLVGIPLMVIFAAVVGFTPSVVRACIMQGLVLVAVAVEKEYDPITAVSFSVLAILVYNPMTVTSVSFQLSVACMLGMLTFSMPIRNYLKDPKRLGRYKAKTFRGTLAHWFASSVAVSLATLAFTLPLCAIYFKTVSLIGILTNLLTLWVIGFIFCGILFSCVISLLWLPLGSFAAGVISVPIHFILGVSRILSRIPFGCGYTDNLYMGFWILCVYVLLGVFLLVRKKIPKHLAGGIAALYLLATVLSVAEPYMDSVRLTMMDVGQGQCILLQSKSNTYLVDCGGDHPRKTADIAMKQLHAQGIYQLDGLILTHYDSDHINGAVYLLEVLPVQTLYLPVAGKEDLSAMELLNTDTPVFWVKENLSFSCGTGTLWLYPAKIAEDSNENSMCILFQNNKCDILITGDRDTTGEYSLLQERCNWDIDVLVAGHHGAETSTSDFFLQNVRPETVLISAGYDNKHGHPSSETLARLLAYGCVIRRTDLEGTIIIRG